MLYKSLPSNQLQKFQTLSPQPHPVHSSQPQPDSFQLLPPTSLLVYKPTIPGLSTSMVLQLLGSSNRNKSSTSMNLERQFSIFLTHPIAEWLRGCKTPSNRWEISRSQRATRRTPQSSTPLSAKRKSTTLLSR